MKIDTGADVTVIGKNHLPLFGIQLKDLSKPDRKLVGQDKHRFRCHGCFVTTLKLGKKTMFEVTYACDQLSTPLLRQPGIEAMELVTIKSEINMLEKEM